MADRRDPLHRLAAAQQLRESGRRVLVHVLEGIAPASADNGGDGDDYDDRIA